VPSLLGRPGFWDTVKGWGLGMCQVGSCRPVLAQLLVLMGVLVVVLLLLTHAAAAAGDAPDTALLTAVCLIAAAAGTAPGQATPL
jgi:hypothetical protein